MYQSGAWGWQVFVKAACDLRQHPPVTQNSLSPKYANLNTLYSVNGWGGWKFSLYSCHLLWKKTMVLISMVHFNMSLVSVTKIPWTLKNKSDRRPLELATGKRMKYIIWCTFIILRRKMGWLLICLCIAPAVQAVWWVQQLYPKKHYITEVCEHTGRQLSNVNPSSNRFSLKLLGFPLASPAPHQQHSLLLPVIEKQFQHCNWNILTQASMWWWCV